MTQTKQDYMCTFIIPIFIHEDNMKKLELFKQALDSIFRQTSPEWSIVMVDDGCHNKYLDEYAESVIKNHEQTIIYHHNETNKGPGVTRNIAIGIANRLGSDIILYLDQDDLADERRVEITREMFRTKNVDVLYTPYIPVDENGNEVAYEDLAAPLQAIADNWTSAPPVIGKNVWKLLFTDNMYANLPSATSVRIHFAVNYPFPDRTSSEDAYTWIMYSLHGAVFECTDRFVCKYRIPSYVQSSSSRDYLGQERFLNEFCEMYTEAFHICKKYALEHELATYEELRKMEANLYINLIVSCKLEGRRDIAKKIVNTYIRKGKQA